MARRDRTAAGTYGLLVAATLLMALVGYGGYVLYPRFDLPAVEGVPLLVLSVGAGIACFFSPCAFPLLVTLLARDAAPQRDGEGGAGDGGPGRLLLHAASVATGATVFLALCGVAIALGAGTAFAGVTFASTPGRWIRAAAGLMLLILGALQLGLLPDWLRPVDEWARPLLAAQARERRRSPALGYAIFGFGYLLAGFG